MTQIISGTGHRVGNDLPCGYDYKHPWKTKKLESIQDYLIETKPDVVISGGATGLDQWLAWAALKLNIPTVFYLPFEGFDAKWNTEQKNQLKKFLSQAQHVEYVCEPGYAAWKMMRRNESMVRDSTSIVSLWNPNKRSGGTFATIIYAISSSKSVMNLWEDAPSLVTKEYLTQGIPNADYKS